MKDDRLYLNHILEAIQRIEEYTGTISRAEFLNNHMLQDAVVRQLEIVGEASRRLSDSVTGSAISVPWHSIVGMRNRIAHDYLNIDLDVIWEVVETDLPVLKAEIRRLLQ